jgi:AcrR family transcriptional regulator
VGEIAAGAGITKPVLYDHFGSKEQLYVELVESLRSELVARGADAMAAGAPAEERVRIAIERFFDWVAERPAAARVLFVPPLGEPGPEAAARRVQDEATAAIAALLGNRVSAPAAEFLKQGLHGLALWWLDHPKTPRNELVDAAMTVAWDGLRRQY